jgi:hypothetical protein
MATASAHVGGASEPSHRFTEAPSICCSSDKVKCIVAKLGRGAVDNRLSFGWQ